MVSLILVICLMMSVAVAEESLSLSDLEVIPAPPDSSANFVALVELGDSSAEELIEKLKNQYDVSTIESTNAGTVEILVLEGSYENIALAEKEMPEIRACDRNMKLQIDANNCVNQATFTNMWGLDRIDQRGPVANPNFGIFSYEAFSPTDDPNVHAYIVDTGIRTSHLFFQGRASWGHTVPNHVPEGNVDLNGHGTHVAGTVGGFFVGVSQNVKLLAVKVFDATGSGTIGDVLAGLAWVYNHHIQENINLGTNCNPTAKKNPGCHKGVANLSLGGPGTSVVLDLMINQLINSGLVVVVAAGNSMIDACMFTPANVQDAITVGATTDQDRIAGFSNFGECVDVFAPGVNILSLWHTSDLASNVLQGTSMAAPHVSGAVANFLLKTNENIDRGVMHRWLNQKAAARHKISFDTCPHACSPNKILSVRCF